MKKIIEKVNEWVKKADKKSIVITSLIIFVLISKLVSSLYINIFEKEGKVDVNNIKQHSNLELDSSRTIEKNKSSQDEVPTEISVYVSGEVSNPGVIKLKRDSRLNDAITKLGGLTVDADTNKINLAMKLEDGSHYIIPKIGEDIHMGAEDIDNNRGYQSENNGKIDINMADEGKLQEITGVGPSTAKKIIEYRNKNGKFNSIDDLKNVTGIGKKKFENMKDMIMVK